MSNNPQIPCQYCGTHHLYRCPQVKSIEYNQDGTVKKVEFITAADYQSVPNYSIWPGRNGDIWPIKNGDFIC